MGVNNRSAEMIRFTHKGLDSHNQVMHSSSTLASSMLEPNDWDLFANGALIGFHAYEVTPCQGITDLNLEDHVPLKTHCMLKIPKEYTATPNANEFGYASDLCASRLTGTSFQRLLQFFGLRWEQESDDDPNVMVPVEAHLRTPDISDIASFISLFNKYPLSTSANFKSFLHHFKLGWFFELDEKKHLLLEYRRFGMMLRAALNFRLACFDGQHRWYLYCMFYSGFMDPQNNLVLDKTIEPPAMNKLRGAQLWQMTSVMIGTPASDHDEYDTELNCFRVFGENANRSQETNVSTDWTELIRETTQALKEAHTSNHLEPLTVANFWQKRGQKNTEVYKHQENTAHVWEYLKALIKAKPSFGTTLLGKTSKDKVNVVVLGQKAMRAFNTADSMFKRTVTLSTNRECEAKNSVPVIAAHFYMTIRVLASHPDALSAFNDVLNCDPDVAQCHDHYDDLVFMRSLEWLRYYALPILLAAQVKYDAKLMSERYILNVGQNDTDTAGMACVDSGDYTDVLPKIGTIKWWMDKPQEDAQYVLGNWSHKSSNHGTIEVKSSPFHTRMLFAAHGCMTEDMFLTIRRWGRDPDLPPLLFPAPKIPAHTGTGTGGERAIELERLLATHAVHKKNGPNAILNRILEFRYVPIFRLNRNHI